MDPSLLVRPEASNMTDDGGPAPSLAVLICTHNGAPYLIGQLTSLACQSHPPDFVCIHDWASTDDTVELIEAFIRSEPAASCWQITRHDCAPGPGPSFLRATASCLDTKPAFDYLLFCDQDDVWHADKLRKFAQALKKQPETQLIYSDVCLIDEKGQLLAPTYLGPGGAFGRPMDIHHRATMFVNSVSGMSMGVSRELLERSRIVWSSHEWFMHDWLMTITACLSNAPVLFLAESLVSYRLHDRNLVGGLKQQRARRSWADTFRKARADVRKVQRQYQGCVALASALQASPLPARLGRWRVVLTILGGRSFRPLRTLNVAMGYALFWSATR